MKAKLLAAVHAALFTAVIITFGLMLFPLTAWSEAGSVATLQKSDLVTPQDFIEYASINDESIHELYFSVILYEGTESCLMCHQTDYIDWDELGWTGDPLGGGDRVENASASTATDKVLLNKKKLYPGGTTH